MSTGAYWRLLYRIVPARTAVPVGIVAGVAGYAAPAATPPEGSRQLMVAPLGVASTGIIGGMGLLAIAGVPVTQARWIVDDREAIRRILTEGPASGHVARAGALASVIGLGAAAGWGVACIAGHVNPPIER